MCPGLRLLGCLTLVGCGSGGVEPAPLTEFPFASATPSCGPADGPAMVITLTETRTNDLQPAGPFARVFLWSAPSELVGRTWSWRNDNDLVGAAHRCLASGDCTNAIDATVTLGRFDADSTLDVRLSLTFADASRLGGAVRARWISQQLRCP
jgi:hypothetical protein